MSGPAHDPQGPPIVALVDDHVLRTRIERAAREMGAVLLVIPGISEDLPASGEVRAFVIDLGVERALDAVSIVREDFPETPVVGALSRPDPDLWTQAEAAGADVVLTHGTIARRLGPYLEEFAVRPRARRVRVAPQRDFEGRLGYVGRIEDDVPEEIALYHVGRRIVAVSNRCPHAGARLSDGELEGSVVTCPRHGSRFDVTTGERVRGPADDPLRIYDVVIEDGDVFVEFGRAD